MNKYSFFQTFPQDKTVVLLQFLFY